MKLIIRGLLSETLGEVELGEEAILIGRDPECTIVLPTPYVSRHHAQIERRNGQYFLRPFGLNGTFVNERLLREKEEWALQPGDIVAVPGFSLSVAEPEAAAGRGRPRLDLMRSYSELKSELHGRLLEKADVRRLIGKGLDDEDRKKRIRTSLDELLSELLDLPGHLEDFVVENAVRLRLMTHLIRGADAGGELARSGTGLWLPDSPEHALDRFAAVCAQELGLLDPGTSLQDKVDNVRGRFTAVYEEHGSSLSRQSRGYISREAIRQDLEALVFGLGPLEDLLKMPGINEIMVVGREQIFVDSWGQLEETGRAFPRQDDLEVVIDRIVGPVGRFVNRSQPIVDARLLDGSRVNIVIPPVSIRGPAITIRRFRKEPFSLEDLLTFGTLNRRSLSFLRACVLARKNIIISGGTGSGKTTLLNTLGSQIPSRERIVVIEDSAELQLPQPNQVVLEARRANVEGEGEISIRDLVRTALRMRPDRVIVGECRGKEALDMLQAMNTGHDGSLTTAHANSAAEMIGRLEVMVLEAGESLPVQAIHRQIAGAIDLIVQIQRQRDGARRVTEITEIVGYDEEDHQLLLENVFHLVESPGRTPALRFSGYIPTFIESLLDRGDTSLEELF